MAKNNALISALQGIATLAPGDMFVTVSVDSFTLYSGVDWGSGLAGGRHV